MKTSTTLSSLILALVIIGLSIILSSCGQPEEYTPGQCNHLRVGESFTYNKANMTWLNNEHTSVAHSNGNCVDIVDIKSGSVWKVQPLEDEALKRRIK